jgi:DNA (cytosine-5)-methyltransferase 1
MAAYYNEIEPYAAQWLRNLISAGHIAPGDVDTRSITDVHHDDLKGYTQHHFFAGIGGWSLALRLAGWPDDRPVWTGSCPCQPFSVAGKQRGVEDERHLWPEFYRLIREYRPTTVFGEQVAGAAGLSWIDSVYTDLEEAGYAVGAADLPACSVNAPHRRQRLWWVAISDVTGLQRHRPDPSTFEWNCKAGSTATTGLSNPWSDIVWLKCSDGKARPTQPGLFPLANGVPNRVGRLRAYGNAIVPQVAAEFIAACMDSLQMINMTNNNNESLYKCSS